MSSCDSAAPGDAVRALNAIRSVVRALNVGTRAVEHETGISLAQLFVLQTLSARAAGSMSELAERTATHQSSVSVVVQRLADRGLVERKRSTTDRRFMQISITDAGRRVVADAPPTVQSRLVEGLRELADEDRHDLAALLERWSHAAGVEIPSSTPMFHEEA